MQIAENKKILTGDAGANQTKRGNFIGLEIVYM